MKNTNRSTPPACLPTWTALSALLALTQAACVTVNVNFPEGAVQKATDDYVRDLYRAKEKGKTPAPAPAAADPKAADPKAAPASKVDTTNTHSSATPAEPGQHSSATPVAPGGFSLVASAWADDGDAFKVDTDKALAIREKLRERLPEILTQKRAGVVGENNDGGVLVKEPGKLKKLLAKKVESLVADENRDRDELYEEILRANGLPKTRLKNVQRSFARSFQSESPSGTWVQDIDGKWAQKP